MTRKELPEDVVTVDSEVTIKDYVKDKTETHVFVSPNEAKKRNNKTSILSPLGLAVIGNKQGDVISWPFPDGDRQIEIINVKRLS